LWSRGPKAGLDLRPGGLLTKLHGSVDWSRRPGREPIYVGGDPGFKGDHERHVILYPGFKGEALEEPFNIFHDHFAVSLRAASNFVVVGFAFRDDRLNELIDRHLPESAKTVVINPRKTIHWPIPEERILHVPECFTAETGKLAGNLCKSADFGRAYLDSLYPVAQVATGEEV